MTFSLRSAAATAALLAASLNLSTLALADAPPGHARPAGCLPERPDAGPGHMHPGMAGTVPGEEDEGGAPAGRGWRNRAPVGSGHAPPWMHRLQLSEAQQDQVFEVVHGREPALRAAFKRVHAAREALHNEALQPGTDTGRLQLAAARVGEADSALALLMAQTDQQLLGLLTAQQQQVLGQCLGPLHP